MTNELILEDNDTQSPGGFCFHFQVIVMELIPLLGEAAEMERRGSTEMERRVSKVVSLDADFDIERHIKAFNEKRSKSWRTRSVAGTKFILEHNLFAFVMGVLTIFALFGYHMQLLFMPMNYDNLMGGILAFATCMFFLELVANSIVTEGISVCGLYHVLRCLSLHLR